MSSERSPTLAEVIGRAIEAAFGEHYSADIAVVTAWDASNQRASCRPLIKRGYLDEEDERQVESLPVITGVPVLFPGAGGFRVTFPLSDGNLVIDGSTVPATKGLLVHCDRSIDKWLTGSGGEVDPEFDHQHALTDAIFIPGLNPFGAPLGSCPGDHATIGTDAGKQIHLHRDTIVAGDEAGAQWVALANKVNDNLTALQTHFAAIEAVLTGSVVNEPGSGAPSALQAALKLSITPSNTYPSPEDVSAEQFKAK